MTGNDFLHKKNYFTLATIIKNQAVFTNPYHFIINMIFKYKLIWLLYRFTPIQLVPL